MVKTGGQIELDVFGLLKDELEGIVSGGVYLQGTRPFDSRKEDAVVSFLTGTEGDVQTGALNVNVYVPDIDMGGEKRVKDVRRCVEVERLLVGLISKPKSEYRFSLGQTISTFAEADIEQHFVNVRLRYKRFAL